MPEYTAYQIKRTILDGSGNRLDLLATLNYQGSVEQEGNEWPDYDDYNTYATHEQTYYRNDDDDSSSSGCSVGLCGLALALVLAKKLMG